MEHNERFMGPADRGLQKWHDEVHQAAEDMRTEQRAKDGDTEAQAKYINDSGHWEETIIDWYDMDGNYLDSNPSGRFIYRPADDSQEDPGKQYIDRYESNEAHANSLTFLGYALLESGVGGDFIAAARNLASRTLNPNDKTKRINEVMDNIKSLGDAIKSQIPAGKFAERYITVTGFSLLGQSALIQSYDSFFLVPRIRQFALDYYDEHIDMTPKRNKFGGAGNADSFR
jgi:hypothetical protein